MKQIKTTMKITIIAMLAVTFVTKAQDYVPKTGGTFTGSIVVKGSLTAGDGNWGAFVINGKDKNDWLLNAHNADNNLHFRSHNDTQASFSSVLMTLNRHSGNIGIGTTKPKKKLHVSNSNSFEAGIIESSNQGGSNLRYIDNSGKAIEIGSQYVDAVIRTNSTVRIVAKSGTGNVGIGTITPSTKLHVKGVSQIEHSNGRSIRFDGYNGIATFGPSHWLHLNRYSDDNVAIGHNSVANVFMVKGGGNVGIGTITTGNHKLAVEGSIGAGEIKVEANGWSDFVFYDNYNLPTLKEVENHIKEKGHLKDIPSAKEVEENGINLGEMDSKLLQKIEELTLYTIEQQKQIEELKHQNTKIKDLEILVQKLLKNND